MGLLGDMIHRCYNDVCHDNENKAQTFFDQLRTDILKIYSEKMQKALDSAKHYLEESDLLKIHNTTKDTSVALVRLTFFCFELMYSSNAKIQTPSFKLGQTVA